MCSIRVQSTQILRGRRVFGILSGFGEEVRSVAGECPEPRDPEDCGGSFGVHVSLAPRAERDWMLKLAASCNEHRARWSMPTSRRLRRVVVS